MADEYIQRSLEPVLKKAAKEFPAVVLTGPRQAGKTTLLKRLFGNYAYVSLEPPDVRAAALADPRGFLAQHQTPVIFDEIQYAPDLLFYIKEHIDTQRNKYGQFLLTGSQNLLLLQQVNESLAGRAAMLRLLPLTYAEIAEDPNRSLPWERTSKTIQNILTPPPKLWEKMLRGCYPELTEYPKKDATLWQASYIQTYLERDIRTLRHVGDLTQFQIFLRTLAARSAQLVQLSDLARDLGITVNTVKAWISILEATYQIIILRPYFANIGKRLVKTPKIYFTDVGTLCYLTGLKDAEHAAHGPMSGALFETAVVAEIFKRYLHQGIEPQLYFWRTATGMEIDLLIENGGQLTPIEVKSSATPNPQMATHITHLRNDLGTRVANGYVIHTGATRLPLGSDVVALPFGEL